MQWVLTVILICFLLVILVNIIIKLRYNRKKALSLNILNNSNKDLKYKTDFITRRLGFNPYDENKFTKISQLFTELTIRYNIDIHHYLVYNHINELKIPGSSPVIVGVPVDIMYNIVSNISRKHELVFKYR